MSDDRDDDDDARGARDREREARERERAAKDLERERERAAKDLERRQAKELERERERAAKDLERERERAAKDLERERELEAKALEREAKELGRERERAAKELEREAKELEREQDQEAKELERSKRLLERETHALERERERAAQDREREAEARLRGGSASAAPGPGDHTDRPDAASDDAAAGSADPDAGDRRWERRHEKKWARFEEAWRRSAEHRERWEARRAQHRERWKHRRRRFKELDLERQMWERMGQHKRTWGPWWMQARMRRRIFTWLALSFASGALGMHFWSSLHWWHAIIAMIALSATSGLIAFRLTRPLIMVIRVAQDIGDGKLETRLDVDSHGGETRLLAIAINEMAERIEQQVKDQRQLLAAVSHELRTPLGHMRVLIDTARGTSDCKALSELECEVLVLDDLVGRLLASSRLEFGNLDCRPIDLGELVTDIATAAGVDPEAIEAIGDVRASVDPTLVRRAVANLLDNARIHGGGAVAVRIERRAAQIAIEVDDAGPGVAADRRADAFRAFVPSRAGGLGLGLALVSRIAVAHNGGAWITDRPGGGARVGFTVELAPRSADGAPT